MVGWHSWLADVFVSLPDGANDRSHDRFLSFQKEAKPETGSLGADRIPRSGVGCVAFSFSRDLSLGLGLYTHHIQSPGCWLDIPTLSFAYHVIDRSNAQQQRLSKIPFSPESLGPAVRSTFCWRYGRSWGGIMSQCDRLLGCLRYAFLGLYLSILPRTDTRWQSGTGYWV